jgi:putative ABC transport system permease protein
MYKNYLQTAFRNLWKHKTFSFINTIGLTIGLTSFILIALYIFDELTYDGFHNNADSIYRIVETKTSAAGQTSKRSASGYQVSERAKAGFPEIKAVARISKFWRPEIRPADDMSKIFREEFVAANPGFLQVFSFLLIYGDPNNALTAPKSVVLTEETAKRFFGKTDAVGKILYFDNDSVPYNVTGILKDFPANSSISYHLLVSESSILSVPEAKEYFSSDWNSGSFSTYFLFDKNADIGAVNTKLDKLITDNHKTESGVKTNIQLQAVKDIHFYSNDIDGDSGKKGTISYIYVFLIVACFIIFIACINYMNLSTARFTTRGKEIAVRKVSGASRATLIRQFLTETLLVTAISVFVSLVLVYFLLPAFNSFTEKHLTLGLQSDYRIWTGVILTLVIVTLAAGLYPALFQSGLNPLSLLKSKIRLGQGNISLRRSLVVFQFVISIVLIAATIIIYQQMQYVNKKDMGFDKEQLVVIDINSGDVRRGVVVVKDEFAKIPEVKSVSMTAAVPGERRIIPSVKVVTDNGNPESGKDLYLFGVDAQFLSTYNIRLLKGRNFFPSGNADSAAVLINETAAKTLGITDALGQPITILSAKFGSDNRTSVEKPFTVNVAGIVKDFNFQSLHEPLAPMILGFDKNVGMSFGYFTVKLSGGDYNAALKKMNAVLQSIDQTHLFEYHFLDKQWEMLYREDKIRQTIFLIVSLLAIFIAALGLLGLTIYAAQQRLREIGIRKVLGANIGGIVLLLSKDFLKLVIVAAVIAVPVTWYFMHRWLEDFAYRIDISWWVFVLSALAAVTIAMLTIGYQVVKAALANPVKSLRVE